MKVVLILTILMAPTNKGKGIFKCREVTCSKTFTLIQNRSKHEKKFKHAPVTRRSSTSLSQYNPDTNFLFQFFHKYFAVCICRKWNFHDQNDSIAQKMLIFV